MSEVTAQVEIRPIRIFGVKMFPVYSTNILAVGYEDSSLIVLFHTGQVYKYYPVPPQAFKDFFVKESVGSYFHLQIKDKYPFTKLTSETDNKAIYFRAEMARIFG